MSSIYDSIRFQESTVAVASFPTEEITNGATSMALFEGLKRVAF